MNQNRPTIPEVLTELGGMAFVAGFLAMAAAPFALPALAFGLLLLPLLLPVLIVALLYGMFALARRFIARLTSRTPPTSGGRARDRAGASAPRPIGNAWSARVQ